jgi:hypothetical protein
MDIVDRLIARAQGTSALFAGSFSDLAVNTRDAQWIDENVNGSSDQDVRFSTELLLRAMRAADFIVTELEWQGSLRELFAGTSRDILIYECLHFSVHALSDAMEQDAPLETIGAISRIRDVACLTASILGSQHLGDFDSTLHCQERRKCYRSHSGKLREMTECLIELLISARGATVIRLSDTPIEHDVAFETEVTLRIATNAAVDICISENAEGLVGRYIQLLEPAEVDSVGRTLPQTEVPAGTTMQYFCVQSRSDVGPMQTYWVIARSEDDARALIALNVVGANKARDGKHFDCFGDDTKTPPPGMIYSDVRGPIPIMILT